MENKLGLRYTTHLIHFHRHRKGVIAVCNPTVKISVFRLQPNRTRIQKIQQINRNGVKWKEARQIQTKQWLIILIRIPEDKE